MLGLIIKDITIFLKKFKNINRILVGIIITLMIFFLKSSGTIFLSIVLPLCTTGIPITLLLSDEKNNWDKYAISTPIIRKKIVLARYITCVGFTLVCSIFTFIMNFLSYCLFAEYTFKIHFLICIIGFLCAYIYLIFIIPTNYAYGANGNSIVMFILLVVILGGTYLMKTYEIGLELIKKMAGAPVGVILLITIIGLIILILLSTLISIKIYEKKYN